MGGHYFSTRQKITGTNLVRIASSNTCNPKNLVCALFERSMIISALVHKCSPVSCNAINVLFANARFGSTGEYAAVTIVSSSDTSNSIEPLRVVVAAVRSCCAAASIPICDVMIDDDDSEFESLAN